jgi:hypothetical protein
VSPGGAGAGPRGLSFHPGCGMEMVRRVDGIRIGSPTCAQPVAGAFDAFAGPPPASHMAKQIFIVNRSYEE